MRNIQCADSLGVRYARPNNMPIHLGFKKFPRGKDLKLVCPGQCEIQWYVCYVQFKPICMPICVQFLLTS